MTSIGYGPKIYLRGVMPQTQTWWLWPLTSLCEELVFTWCLFGSSRPICVNMCALWKNTRNWSLPLFLAIASALPYYDSLRSSPKPHLIPETLISITHVQFCVCPLFLEFLLAVGRNFRPEGPSFRGPEFPVVYPELPV